MIYIFGACHGATEMLEDTEFFYNGKQIITYDVKLVEDAPHKADIMSTLKAYETIGEGDYGVISAWSPKWKAYIDKAFNHIRWASAVSRGAKIFKKYIPEGLNIRTGAVITSTASVGRHVRMNSNSFVGQDTSVGDFSFLAIGATLLGFSSIGKGSVLYSGAVINPGISVGDNTVIGAGSVVTRDIPDGVIAYGTPCRVIRENNLE